MRRKIIPFATSLIATLAAGFLLVSSVHAEPKPIRMLFIGNSYTLFNDMPQMVTTMGRGLGYDIRVTVSAAGGASFYKHLRRTETRQAIAAESWDVVLLQDYSLNPGQRPSEVRTRHLPSARALVRLIRKNRMSTRVIYYETWGRRSGDALNCWSYRQVCTFDGHAAALQAGYRMYRDATGGAIATVGSNWRRVANDRSGRRPFRAGALWLNDGSHPSRYGSYLAAATILRQVIGKPIGRSGYDGGLSPRAAEYLRKIVDAAAAAQARH